MPPNKIAKKNHDHLFPNHVSTVAITDPELIETLDNFEFDEVLRDSKLPVKTRLIIQLAAIIESQAVREYRAMLGAALNVGVTPIEAKEILYQAVPYVGIAKTYDFIEATNDVLTERGVIARSRIAEALVHSLTSDQALRKTLDLVATKGPAQKNLDGLFAAFKKERGQEYEEEPIAAPGCESDPSSSVGLLSEC